jgi:hypothetical protein
MQINETRLKFTFNVINSFGDPVNSYTLPVPTNLKRYKKKFANLCSRQFDPFGFLATVLVTLYSRPPQFDDLFLFIFNVYKGK